MFAILRLLLTAAIGAVLGLGSVWVMLNDPRVDFTPRLGPWRITLSTGEGLADPYAIARTARSGRISLGAAEGVAFVTALDSEGRPLDPACHYQVAGPVPTGDLWTLTVTDSTGRPPDNPAGRVGFSGRDAIRRADGTVSVVIGPTIRPGNSIPVSGLADLVVTLRVYSTSLASRLPAAADLPGLERLSCGGPFRVG